LQIHTKLISAWSFERQTIYLARLDYYILQKISPFCDNNLSLVQK